MGGIRYNNQVLNQRGTPSFFQDVIANRPSAGVTGRIFVSTDTFVIQRDTGTAWQNIGGAFAGSGAVGQVAFFDTTSSVAGDNGLFWDNTNKRLGIGTITPGVKLDIHGTGVLQQLNGTTTNSAFLDFQNAGTTRFRIGNEYNGGAYNFNILNNNTNENAIGITQSNGYMRFNSPSTTNLGNIYEFYSINKSNSAFSFFSFNNNATGADLSFYKSRGTSFNTFSPTLNNDNLCVIGIAGTTSGFVSGALLRFWQNGSVGTSVPTDLQMQFYNATGISTNRLSLVNTGYSTFADRLNVNNATDNALFELNVNGNTYTGGLSPTILTISGNTTMLRTTTGYYCTATLTLTLPSAASINNIYYVIAGAGATITINRAGTDDILNLAGASVTSITLTPNQRCMLYVGGGTRTFLIFQV